MEQTFAGQRIVITGGSGGIGVALARDLIDRGAATIVLIGRDRDKLAAAAAQLGAEVQTAAFDVTDEASVAAFFADQPKIDHLVTAAAGTVRGQVTELEVARARALFESKYWGQYLCCKYGAPKLAEGGSIVLFSGWISRKPMAGVSTLAAVDAAVEALGRTLALEIAPRRVNTLVPGMIDTPLWSARLSAEEQRAHFQKVGAGLPVGRAGVAQDVAHACRFLMENGFVTGITLDVDGGQR
ncbi:MAG: SDR family oxidoreductase [Rhodobacteraceae bacterium]|nr:SDR family oxidoreductase [Paracoccaceae bacterium]